MFLGVTGGIGCGKSVACSFLGRMGWLVLDADDICHSLYESPEEGFQRMLIERWGPKVAGEGGAGLDRGAIADVVFNSEDELAWLNSFIHPAVYRKALDIKSANPGKDAVFDVPLLFEAGWKERFDAVVAVWSEDGIRFSRLRSRGMAEDEVVRREVAQMPSGMKLDLSDYALINNGSLEFLRSQCESLSEALRNGGP